jgi:hypothetical protein
MTLAKDVEQGKVIKKVFKINKPEIDGDLNDDNSPLLFTITTDAVDRDRDVIDPSGILVDNYRDNAVMQWAHQYDELPVGKSVEMFSTQIKAMKDGTEQSFNAIKARVEFQPDSNYHESYTGLRGSMVRRMYLTGFLNAVSIGFDPQEWVAIGGEDATEKVPKTPSDLLNMQQLNNGTRFTSWELLEFSAVPVPANPQALIDRDYKQQLKSWADKTLDYCKDGECPAKAVKAVEDIDVTNKEAVEKAGRVLSSKNEKDIATIADLSGQVATLAKGILEQVVPPAAPKPAAPTAPTAPTAPVAVAPIATPPKSIVISYPLGHDAPVVKEVAEPMVTEVEIETPTETLELFRVDLEVLAGVLGVDVETLESLTAQAEGEQTEE